jgi:adenylate cyclase
MEKKRTNVKKILFQGVFWRILAIEAILLVWSLIYRELTESPGIKEQFWYAMYIILLIGIIILFMMVTLRSFFIKKIISPLEAIVSSNRELTENNHSTGEVNLSNDAPQEIKEIVSSRTKMLNTILTVSEERLRLVNFIRETFGRYLSKKVVDEILEKPEGRKIGGRRETVTILMSDLRGFTSLSETRDPEELVRLLNRYLKRMSKVILDHDGMIDEFIGDAILVVFGVPESRDDDALRAVACGLSMQNALIDLNKEIALEGYPPLEMGIGINTGTVIVGNIGSEARLKYGIVGAAVNTAARIESNTVGGQVLIGESTYRLVQESLTTEAPQTVMMKGMKRPLVNYPVTAIGPPYDIELHFRDANQNGIQLSLPFHCWKVEEKKIAGESCVGETVMLNENVIVASIKPPLEPLTDIKLRFDFCMEAHCFDDIYGKILPPTDHDDHSRSQLRITSIKPVDRDILKKWMEEAT